MNIKKVLKSKKILLLQITALFLVGATATFIITQRNNPSNNEGNQTEVNEEVDPGELAEEGDYEKAANAFKQAGENEEESDLRKAELLEQAGYYYEQVEKYAEAVGSYKQAIEAYELTEGSGAAGRLETRIIQLESYMDVIQDKFRDE